MATITTANNNSALNSSRRSYVAVKDFNNSDFSSYSVAMNSSYVNIGTLSAVTTDAALAPKGRVLRENGRKLYPGANPGVTRYLVGVYDSETSLSGFIDPNSPTFTIFNSDRPNYIPVDDTVDIGAPVYTAGTIEADGTTTLNDTVTVNTGSTDTAPITAATYVTGTGYLTYTALNTFLAGNSVTITGVTVSAGSASVYNITGVIFSATSTQFIIHSTLGLGTNTANNSTGTAVATQSSLVVTSANTTVRGGLVLGSGKLYVPVNKVAGVATLSGSGHNTTVSTTAVTTTSVILLTSLSGVDYVYSVVSRATGSFIIRSSQNDDAGYVSWFVINTV